MRQPKFNIGDKVYYEISALIYTFIFILKNNCFKMNILKHVFLILIFISALICTSCGSKKTIAQSHTKEKTDIELTDNSKINSKIEQEKQLVNTNTKERIVTMYGVRLDTIYKNGEPVIIPLSYLVSKEENRDIAVKNHLYRLSLLDSTQNAVELKYSNKINEKERKIEELKESTRIYQSALFILSVICAALLFFKEKNRFTHRF